MTFNMLVLPAPLRPTSPTLSPARTVNEASTRVSRPPTSTLRARAWSTHHCAWSPVVARNRFRSLSVVLALRRPWLWQFVRHARGSWQRRRLCGRTARGHPPARGCPAGAPGLDASRRWRGGGWWRRARDRSADGRRLLDPRRAAGRSAGDLPRRRRAVRRGDARLGLRGVGGRGWAAGDRRLQR